LNTNQKSCGCKENICNIMRVMISYNYTYIEVITMAISYKKLWKLLIDRDMKKKDLQKLAGISSATITKLGKNENVSTEIIQKICIALKCDVCDIMEMDDSKRS
jgi:putative transcriptional regulator